MRGDEHESTGITHVEECLQRNCSWRQVSIYQIRRSKDVLVFAEISADVVDRVNSAEKNEPRLAVP